MSAVLPRVLSRSAMFLFVAAQLCLALASFSEGRYGTDARAHVEAAGTSTHHAHDEGGCAACSARALLSLHNRPDRAVPDAGSKPALAESQIHVRPDVSFRASARPRAPPLRQA